MPATPHSSSEPTIQVAAATVVDPSAPAAVTRELPTPAAPTRSEGAEERGRMVGRASIVAVGTLLSRMLGLGRDLVLAAVFPRADTDLFFVAFTIPNALRQLLAEGALSSAFVPVLAKVSSADGPKAAAQFYRQLRAIMLWVLLGTCALGMVAAPWLCELFAAGFHRRPHAFERTVALTRWVFPYLLFMGLAALGAGALQTQKLFLVASFAPGLLNVAMIIAAVALPALLVTHGIDPLGALAIGALIGGLLQVLAQEPALRRAGFGPGHTTEPSRSFAPELRDVIRRILPMTFGMAIYELDLVLSRRFLSQAGEGANSYFYYAQRLCDFPQGVFSLALATATLPSLARLVATNQRSEVARTAEHAVRLAVAVAVPATALLVALAEPLVTALFARGAFDAESVRGTSTALMAQGLGVVLVAVVRQLVPVYYALGDTKTPVWVSFLDLLAFVAFAWGLQRVLGGHLSVSWAVTGSSLVQMVLLVALLPRVLPEVRFGAIASTFARGTLASIGAGALAWWLAGRAATVVASVHVALIRSTMPAVVGLVAFGLGLVSFGRVLGVSEWMRLEQALTKRLRRRT